MQPILKVNLSSGEIGLFDIPKEWEDEYLGGASLAARILYPWLSADLDPLSPEAPLLFLNGPLSGTSGPTVGRFVICGRSPATRLWAESNCGGFWGPELRMAGYDGLWIEGRADRPVYLWIKDQEIKILPAEHIWGKDTYETILAVEQECHSGKVRVAVIGPAGEAQIPYALILCDHGRVAGRTGMGALMGSKHLKAVAVQGNGKVPVYDLSAYLPLRSEANRTLKTDHVSAIFREMGTANGAEYFDYLGELPKQYFRRGAAHEELKISGAYLKDNLLTGVSACHACVIACGRVVTLDDGKKRKGPEYETLVGFGPNLGLNDAVLATHLGEICDRYGLDTISMSNVIGLAYYLYETGLITAQDTGGLVLTWGSGEPVAQLIHKTVKREGLGFFLAEGAKSFGRAFNAEDEAVQVNNLEVAFHDPRAATGMALVYATSPRGACHNQSDYFMVDIWQSLSSIGISLQDRLGGAEKAADVARHQDWRTISNALVMCIFVSLYPEEILPLINAACGLNWSLLDLMKCGERGWNLKRAINHRLGLTRENDTLPKPLLDPYQDDPNPDAPFKIDFEPMLAAYYLARGWEPETGLPSREKLTDLGLSFTIPDLYPTIKTSE